MTIQSMNHAFTFCTLPSRLVEFMPDVLYVLTYTDRFIQIAVLSLSLTRVTLNLLVKTLFDTYILYTYTVQNLKTGLDSKFVTKS